VKPLLRPLDPSQDGVDAALMLEIEAVKVFAADWPLIPEKKKIKLAKGGFQIRVEARLAEWQEFWGGIVDDPAFVDTAPTIRVILQIILVQCHGGIENERSFSGMNYIHSDDRNRLKPKHLNCAMRTWHERDRLLASGQLFASMWEELKVRL
jgi:hypothetical protein